MIAGLILSDQEDVDSCLAFIGDETKTYSLTDNDKIVEKISEFGPDIVAVDVGIEESRKDLTESEEELKEEGYSFTPSSSESRKIRRLQGIQAYLQKNMDNCPEFIRFDPYITSDELALDSDESIESLGVDSSSIDSAREFDAVLGGVTARFYQQDQFRDLGVVVPESLESSED